MLGAVVSFSSAAARAALLLLLLLNECEEMKADEDDFVAMLVQIASASTVLQQNIRSDINSGNIILIAFTILLAS